MGFILLGIIYSCVMHGYFITLWLATGCEMLNPFTRGINRNSEATEGDLL